MPEDVVKENIAQGLDSATQASTPEPKRNVEQSSSKISRGLSSRQETRLAAAKATAEKEPESVKPEDTATSEESSQTVEVEDSPSTEEVTAASEETVTDEGEETEAESSDDEVVATSDESESTDTEEEKEDEWFYVGTHTQYRTAEDAVEGIEQAQLYIHELKAKEDSNATRVTELEAVNAFYQQVMDQDVMRSKAIQTYLPDEYKGKAEEDFEDDQDARKFVRAVIQAEERFKADLQNSQDAAKKAQKEQNELADAARKFVASTVNAKFFGAKNPQALKVANDKLKETVTEEGDESLDARQVGQLIHEMFGKKAANFFFRGLREDLQGAIGDVPSSSVKSKVSQKTTPKKKSSETKTQSKQEEVIKKVKETQVRQTPIASVAPVIKQPDNRSARDKISGGLASALGKK
jgi:hypothetical protein